MECLLPRVETSIRAIVGRRAVPFCREVSYVVGWRDPPLWPDYVSGLPMTGWACPALALPSKLTSLSRSVDSLLSIDGNHNEKILGSVKSTGDPSLDMASWQGSKKEFAVKT